jgi:hypothetical protein
MAGIGWAPLGGEWWTWQWCWCCWIAEVGNSMRIGLARVSASLAVLFQDDRRRAGAGMVLPTTQKWRASHLSLGL